MEKQQLLSKVNELYEAKDQLLEAIETIKEATKGTEAEATGKHYVADNLTIIATSDHGFLSNSENVDGLIELINQQIKDLG